MDEQQPTFKVVDRRPFNPDGTPRELSPEEKKEAAQVAESPKAPEPPPEQAPAPTDRQATNTLQPESQESQTPPRQSETRPRTGDPLDDPASERKTKGNLDAQEAEALEGLLADLRMQFVSFTNAPSPPSKFSAGDITGGK